MSTNLALLAEFEAVHLLSESRRFLFTYNISLIKVLLSHCHVHFAFWELAVNLCYKK